MGNEKHCIDSPLFGFIVTHIQSGIVKDGGVGVGIVVTVGVGDGVGVCVAFGVGVGVGVFVVVGSVFPVPSDSCVSGVGTGVTGLVVATVISTTVPRVTLVLAAMLWFITFPSDALVS